MDSGRSNDGGENAKKIVSKRWSKVWDHFTLDEGSIKAVCNYCEVRLRGDSQAGTSHLKRHLQKSCKSIPYKDASSDFQSSQKKIMSEHTIAFGEKNMASIAQSRGKKRASHTGAQEENDHEVKKRARLNNEKQLKRLSEESSLIPEGDMLIGVNNKLTEQIPVQSASQIRNCSNLELREALISVPKHLQLIEQKQQQKYIINSRSALQLSDSSFQESQSTMVFHKSFEFKMNAKDGSNTVKIDAKLKYGYLWHRKLIQIKFGIFLQMKLSAKCSGNNILGVSERCPSPDVNFHEECRKMMLYSYYMNLYD